MMATLVSSWRKVWSATPGTTDPLAPFGIVSLADGTDEGFGGNMRGFRWAQTAGYGALPNPAMPNSFLADTYDLGDPWHTPQCGTNGTFGGGHFAGQMCCVDKSMPLGPKCVGDHRGGNFVLNDTRDWANLGTLHPRVKKQVGQRLAQGLLATAYNGSMPVSGPVLAGCQVSADKQSLLLKFAAAGLRGETVLFDQSNTIAKEVRAMQCCVSPSLQCMLSSSGMMLGVEVLCGDHVSPHSCCCGSLTSVCVDRTRRYTCCSTTRPLVHSGHRRWRLTTNCQPGEATVFLVCSAFPCVFTAA